MEHTQRAARIAAKLDLLRRVYEDDYGNQAMPPIGPDADFLAGSEGMMDTDIILGVLDGLADFGRIEDARCGLEELLYLGCDPGLIHALSQAVADLASLPGGQIDPHEAHTLALTLTDPLRLLAARWRRTHG